MSRPWEKSWKTIRKLGKGGQGVTFKVERNDEPHEIGALKYLINNKSQTARARLLREVGSLQSLASLGGNVPSVLDHNAEAFLDTKIELYLVMQFIDGLTLSEFVEKHGLLTVNQAAAFALSLCATVKLAHGESIIHRDIKPDNIIVPDAESNSLYLVDYGLSFNVEDENITELAESFRNKFLALPEANTPSGDRRDPRSDVTAVCAVFYYMLTGHSPGHLQDAQGKLPHLRIGFSVREAIADDPRRNQVELILSRGLQPQVESRFQTIDELSDRLQTLLSQSDGISVLDPIEVAKDLSIQLRERDRPTQLGEFRPAANKLLKDFIRVAQNKFAKSLGRFKFSASDGGFNVDLPSGLDLVVDVHNATLTLDNHGEVARRAYKIASRGEQCVVVASDLKKEAARRGIGGGQEYSKGTFQEIAWYEGEPTDVMPTLEAELGQWLVKKMQDACTGIQTGTQPDSRRDW